MLVSRVDDLATDLSEGRHGRHGAILSSTPTDLKSEENAQRFSYHNLGLMVPEVSEVFSSG